MDSIELLEHQDFSPFEYACQLGNLMGLKIILSHQEPYALNPVYLNGLLLSIHHQQTEVIQYLFEHPSYASIIQNHRAVIVHEIQEAGLYPLLETYDFLLNSDNYRQIELPLEEFKNIELNMPEQIILKDLSAYYQSCIANQSLKQHFRNLQEKIAELYQTQPISFQTLNGQQFHLPLTYESFLKLQTHHNEADVKAMHQAYLRYPIHSAWRFLQNEDPWDPQHYPIFSYPKDIQWLLILMGYAACDEQFVEKQLFQVFINELGMFEKKVYSPQKLSHLLLQSVNEHSLTQIFDLTILKREHQDFLKQHWTEHFHHRSHEDLILLQNQSPNALIHHAKENQKLLQGYCLREADNQEFEELMRKKWGSRWLDNPSLIKYSRQQLLSPEIHRHYHQTFEECLNRALQKSRLNQFNFFYLEAGAAEEALNHHHKIH